MATQVMNVLSVNSISSMNNAELTDKQYAALQYDGGASLLTPGSKFILLSLAAKKYTWPGLNATGAAFVALTESGKLRMLGRGQITGTSGYTEKPHPGRWELNSTHEWWYLHTQEEDPATKSWCKWGLASLLEGILDERGSGSLETKIRACVYVEITENKNIYGRNPVNVDSKDLAKEKSSCEFYKCIRKWGGKAHFATRKEIDSFVGAYNSANPAETPLPKEWLKSL